jgi:hypothetical protein
MGGDRSAATRSTNDCRGVEAEIADRFVSSLACSLAQALEVGHAFVTRLSDEGSHVKMLAILESEYFRARQAVPMS